MTPKDNAKNSKFFDPTHGLAPATQEPEPLPTPEYYFNCDTEATHMNPDTGAGYCATCANAYEAGQAQPDTQLDYTE